jgi:hypothetical protein
LPFKSCGPLDAWMKKTKNDIPPPRKFVPALSERTDAAIQRSMHSEPTKRPASCQEFIADLSGTDASKSQPGMWYLIYKDAQGVTHTVKGTVVGIRRSFKNGELGEPDNIRACQTKTGEFRSLLSYPEFSDLAEVAEKRSDSTEETPNYGQAPVDAPVNTYLGNQSAVPPAAAFPGSAPETPASNPAPAVSNWVTTAVMVIIAMAVGAAVVYFLK